MNKSVKDLTIPEAPKLGVQKETPIAEEDHEDSLENDIEEWLGFLKESNNDNFLRSIKVLTKGKITKEVNIEETPNKMLSTEKNDALASISDLSSLVNDKSFSYADLELDKLERSVDSLCNQEEAC